MKKRLFTLIVMALLFDYSKSQCSQACGQYSLINITHSVFPNTGTFVTLGDDDTTTFVPIGFTFNFYCNNYTKVKICSNGFISFDNSVYTTSSTPYAQSLPSTTLPNAVIAYNWNDLDPSAGGTVGYNTIGTSPNQIFIVTYSNVPLWSYGGSNTGQILLYEADGSIEVHTGMAINNGFLTHTQGIENAAASAAVPVPGRNLSLWTATNSAYRWEKMIVGAPPTGISGNTIVCFGQQEIYTVNSMSGASSYSWTLPGGWIGTSTTTALTATTGVSGNLSVTATYTCGVSAPAIISVTVNPAPLLNVFNVAPPSLCSGSLATVSASGAATYTLDPIGLTGTPPFTLIAAANTVYSISGTSNDGCLSLTPAIVPITVFQSPTLTVNSGTMCLGQTFTISPTGAINYSYSSLFSTVAPTVTGTYSFLVIGSATNACLGYAVSSLTVNPLPTVIANVTKPVICAKESSTLSVSGASTYSWLPNNSTNTSVVVSPTTTSSYTVTGTNSLGCSKSSTLTVQVNPCLGLNESQSGIGRLLTYFPNPGSGLLHLVASSPLILCITDINGKELFRQTYQAGSYELNIQHLSNGIYQLRVFDGSRFETGRLIKE